MRHPVALCLLLLAGLLLAAAAPALGQTPSDPVVDTTQRPHPPYRWEADLFYTYESLTDDRNDWQRLEVLAQRRFEQGTLIVKGIRARRFAEWDHALAVEAYWELWRRAYGHLRVQRAFDPEALAETDLYAELFQGLPGGWELSGSYGLRRYADVTVHRPGLGLAKYVGNWYVRAQTRLVPLAGETGITLDVAARRFLGPPTNFVEMRAGVGRGVALVGAGPVVDITHTFFVSARFQQYVSERFGLTAGAAYSDDDYFARRSLHAGLLVRW